MACLFDDLDSLVVERVYRGSEQRVSSGYRVITCLQHLLSSSSSTCGAGWEALIYLPVYVSAIAIGGGGGGETTTTMV